MTEAATLSSAAILVTSWWVQSVEPPIIRVLPVWFSVLGKISVAWVSAGTWPEMEGSIESAWWNPRPDRLENQSKEEENTGLSGKENAGCLGADHYQLVFRIIFPPVGVVLRH